MISLPADGRKHWIQLLPFWAFFILLFLLTCRLPFFWDKDILYSKIAHYLLEHRFTLRLPNDLDTGYPPALAYLLALVWKLAGKSLFAAHLIMLPFTMGIVWQTYKLINRLFEGRYVVPAMIIVFTDTVLLSQTVVFSTDLVMLFCMILAINSILENRRVLLAIAVAGMLFSHMRGLMVTAALVVFDLFHAPGRKSLTRLIQMALSYLPALSFFVVWIVWHYRHTGWFLMHAASPWAGCYEPVDVEGFARNVVIVIWRMVDYGRAFVWLIPFLALFSYKGKLYKTDRTIQLLVLLMSLTLLVIVPSMLIFKILNGHRYLMPFFFLLSLLAAYLLFVNPGFHARRKIMFAVVVSGLLSGSFWVYPGKIANGWDATLAHMPYHHLRREMIRYLDEKKIPFDQVGSEVPNIAAIRYIDLNKDDRSFHRADLQTDQYVFYSNIFNMFTDEEIDELNNQWTVEKEYHCLQVYVKLYRKGAHGGSTTCDP